MKTPKEILDYVGRENAQKILGVSKASIDRAARGDQLSAAWLDALERLAKRPLPRELFSFKGMDR